MKLYLAMLFFALCFSLSTANVARAAPDDERNEPVRLPPNLVVSKSERSLLEKIWRRSATFRRQCERLAEAQWLKVNLSFYPKALAPCGCRALTTVYGSKPVADVRIFQPSSVIELIGHELEHVLEQIEGVNLRVLVAAQDGRAQRTEHGHFETERAVLTGRQVRTEYNRARRNEALMTQVVAKRPTTIE